MKKLMLECIEMHRNSECDSQPEENDQKFEGSLISIKTKKHKSLGVLCLVFIKLFFEKSKTLTIEEISNDFNINEKQM